MLGSRSVGVDWTRGPLILSSSSDNELLELLQEGDVSSIDEEGSLGSVLQVEVGFGETEPFGIHHVSQGNERSLGIAVATVQENPSWASLDGRDGACTTARRVGSSSRAVLSSRVVMTNASESASKDAVREVVDRSRGSYWSCHLSRLCLAFDPLAQVDEVLTSLLDLTLILQASEGRALHVNDAVAAASQVEGL